jgi:hypothetical protein
MQGLGLHGQVPVRLRLPHPSRVVQGPEDPPPPPPDQPALAQVPVGDHPLQHLPSPWTLGAQSVCTVVLSAPPLLLFVETSATYVCVACVCVLYGDVCPTVGCAVPLRFGDPHDISKFQSYPLLQSEVW